MSTETLIQKEKLITVANLRDTAHGLRCDRGTPMGNPFVLLAKEPLATRKLCVAGYGFYLHLVANEGCEPIDAIELIRSRQKPGQRPLLIASTKPPARSTFLAYLAEIESRYLEHPQITLLCWCAPLPCHCDRIAAYLRWKYAPNNCPPYIQREKPMTRNQAQDRLSKGFPVYVQVLGDHRKHQIKSIGLTICHSMGNRRFDNKNVEFTT